MPSAGQDAYRDGQRHDGCLAHRRRAALALPFAAALAAPPRLARAQERFPSRPITVLVPFPPGGATDVQMRAMAEAATRAFGQTVIVENKPGAGSTLGASTVARAQPDGYLITQMTLPCLRLPWMQPMPFDPRTDFTPIIHLTGYLFGVVVRADGPYKTWQDLVADARKRPGRVRIGNTGANGTPHLTMVDLAEREKLDVIHVPVPRRGRRGAAAARRPHRGAGRRVRRRAARERGQAALPEPVGARAVGALAGGADAGRARLPGHGRHLALRAVRAARHESGGGRRRCTTG